MGTRTDAVVIGAGHNGLVAALTLAADGRKVTVLERAPTVGGVCAEREFHPGFKAPGLLQDTSTFRPELIEAFDLTANGLKLRRAEAPVLVADSAGAALLLHRDPALAREEIARISEADAEAYAAWRAFLAEIRGFIRRLLDNPPPPLKPGGLGELWTAGLAGFALRSLGRRKMTELLRVLPMNAADWLEERFETGLLCAGLAVPGVLGTYNGPWAAGTAAQLILQESTKAHSVDGGPAALVRALESAASVAGIEIRTSAEVERVLTDGTSFQGIRLASGEVLEADLAVATCDPKRALLDLVGARYLDSRTVHDLENFRSRGTTAILHLAVQGSVEVPARPGEPIEHLRLGGGTLDEIERAFDAAKYGQRSEHPQLEIHIPSVANPELAPDGSHVVIALVSCAPHDLVGGWNPAVREALISDCVHLINEHVPGLRERLVSGELLAPPDLESEYALPGGHLHHGEHAPDQLLFLRPTQHLSGYATSIAGLYLGSSGCHPGGGVTGMPGRLAAQTALAGS
jgi:phytoene dehydrogenase-like protein